MKTENDIGYFVREIVCKEEICDYCHEDTVKKITVDLEAVVGCEWGIVELEAFTCAEHSDGIVDKLISERMEG